MKASGDHAHHHTHVEDLTFASHPVVLPESDILFERLIDNLPQAVLIVSQDQQIVRGNLTGYHMFGYTEAELLGQPLEILLPAARRAAHTGHVKKFLAAPAQRKMGIGQDLVAQHKDGSQFPVEIGLSHIEVAGDTFGIAIVTNISERIQMQAEALQKYDGFRRTFHNGPLAMVITRLPEGTILDANKSYCDLIGWPRSEVLGRTTLQLGIVTDRVEREMVVNTIVGAGMIKRREMSLRNRLGTIHDIIVSTEQIVYEGHEATLAAIIDVTDVKRANDALAESEERFRSIVNSMNDIVFTLDRDGRHTALYGDWYIEAGLTKEMFLGKTAREILGDEAAEIHEPPTQKALQGHFVTYDWSAPDMQGRTRYYHTALSPIRNSQDEITGLVGVGRDVTDLHETEMRLKQMARLAAGGEVAAGVAHQINNPLAAILVQAQLLSASLPDDDPAQTRLEIIERASKQAGTLVQRVLTLDDPVTFNLSPVDVNDTISSAMALIRAQATSRPTMMTANLNDHLPQIHGSDRHLHQCWLHLLSNAVDSIPKDAPAEIEVYSGYDAEEDVIIVGVRDNGIGIPDADLENVFLPLFGTKAKSTGLGLTYCLTVITAHNGTITVNSTEGSGTEVVVKLPVAPPERAAYGTYSGS